MIQKSLFDWIIRAMGIVLLLFSILATIIAYNSRRAGVAVYFVDATGFFFGSGLLLGSFDFKKLSAAAGVLTLLSLLSSDLAKWKDGTKSIQDVVIPWSLIAVFLTVALIFLSKRSKKNSGRP